MPTQSEFEAQERELAETPEPWLQGWYRRADQDQGFDIYGADHRTIARVPVIGGNRELQECHARLIAAAPKTKRERDALLSAARDALSWLKEGEDGSPPSFDSIDEAKNHLRDAIASVGT